MPRPQTAFWTLPGKADDETAAALLVKWESAIHRRVTWYERTYPGEVDWESVIWMAAYRAAYAFRPGNGFWQLLKLCVDRGIINPLARRHRRNAKLRRVDTDLDVRLYYREHWDVP